MTRRLLYIWLMILPLISQGQYSVVLIDSITDGISFIDNNYLVLPEGYDAPIRAYKITSKADNSGLAFPAITSSDTILANGWPRWITGAFDCFDYVFPRSIIREPGDTIRIEFDLMFDVVRGSGEAGRLNVALVDGLPPNGIQLDNAPVNLQAWRAQYEDPELSNMYNMYGSADMFGQPAYHVWIFSGNYGPALSYGGAYDVYPGWNSGAGRYYYNMNAGDHENLDLYPLTDNYPKVPYSKRFDGGPYASVSKWKRYTWVIAEQMMHLYWRDADKGPEADEEIIFMAIPTNESNIHFINTVHETSEESMPPAYKWYEQMNALRFYYHGNNVERNFYLTNLVVTKTGRPISTFVEFQRISAARRRIRANQDSYQLPVVLQNGIDGDPTSVTLKLKRGNPDHINGFTQQHIVFPDDTGGDMYIESLNLTLTDIYMTENDTLVFELANPQGGYYPAVGGNSTFELVIRPSGETPSSIAFDSNSRGMVLYPNPVSARLFIHGLEELDCVGIEVVDVTGNVLLRPACHGTEGIDVSNLPADIYIVRFIGREYTFVSTFIRSD